MSKVAVGLLLGGALLGFAACEFSGGTAPSAGPPDMEGWRYASGKRPTRAEYAAIVAGCQDGAVPRARGKALDACLADLGLRRD